MANRTHAAQGIHWIRYGYEIGVIISRLRRERGLSQQELAHLSGLSRNQISNLERNENTSHTPSDPRVSTMYLVAKALDVEPQVLFPFADQKVQRVGARSIPGDDN